MFAGPPTAVATCLDTADTLPLDVAMAADPPSSLEMEKSPDHDPEKKRHVFQKGVGVKDAEKNSKDPKDENEKNEDPKENTKKDTVKSEALESKEEPKPNSGLYFSDSDGEARLEQKLIDHMKFVFRIVSTCFDQKCFCFFPILSFPWTTFSNIISSHFYSDRKPENQPSLAVSRSSRRERLREDEETKGEGEDVVEETEGNKRMGNRMTHGTMRKLWVVGFGWLTNTRKTKPMLSPESENPHQKREPPQKRKPFQKRN